MTQESVGESQAGFTADLARLKNHQKSRTGAPVVSQAMTRPIVPVGAMTVDWALR